ncbi:rab-like protein 3 [Hetaerina americana]|uniref:rab-like protein 3 n=1 Tax=Hetaerina americana TaxID=62018 RepID=UPI003A7F33FB
MAAIDKVRVIVVGDSGVGKSSLTHLICHKEPIKNPSWTVGCSVEVMLHEYKEGTPCQKTYFVELWDIGGSSSHRNTRSVFYQPTHGIILVHDLTNRKSQQNLNKWLAEVLNKDSNSKSRSSGFDSYDPEQFVGSTQIPMLVIGTKLDLAADIRPNITRRCSSIAEECGADEILLDSHQVRSLAAGSGSAVKLTRFFDKVIERRYQRQGDRFSSCPPERRRPKLYVE